MLTDRDLCRALSQSLRTGRYLVVAKLVDAERLRRTTSIPTAAFASRRFEVDVLASTNEWIAGGPPSSAHVALLFEAKPDPGLAGHIARSLTRYGFIDPWAGAGQIDLLATAVALPFADIGSLAEAFKSVDRQLTDVAGNLIADRQVANKIEQWCAYDAH